MEFLKKRLPLIALLAFAMPLILANKECSKRTLFQHPKIEAGMTCKDCHEEYISKETRPKSHDLSWKKEHGDFVKREGFKSEGRCAICHTESTCSACHAQDKPQDHTNFFRLRGHGLMVGLDRSRCYTCHQADFCQRCHSQTRPQDHAASWGAPLNRHCLFCHYPIASAGSQRCAVCHAGTPSHLSAPKQPSNALHLPGADCRSCHNPLRHPDNGMTCIVCHSK
jgi:hypothetical protein